MSTRTTRARQLGAGALAALTLAGALAGAATTTSGAASTDDPFSHSPIEVECNPSSVYLVLSADTAKITTPTSGPAVVWLSSGTGDMSYSPQPLGFPQSSAGSIYWEIPYADIESAQITWTLKVQSDGAYIDSGTVDFDFVGLCGTVPSTTPTTTAPEPPTASTDVAEATDPAAVTAPEAVVAIAVAARPAVTG